MRRGRVPPTEKRVAMRVSFAGMTGSARPALVRVAAAVLCLAFVAAGKPNAPAPGKGGPAAKSDALEVKADVALLADAATGATLWVKNPSKPFAPASLTKMMTVAVAAEELKQGRLSLDGEFTMSEHAWRTGGAPSHTSTMFAPVNSKVKIADLFRGTMILSANDGAIAIAEGIAGSEAAFAELMNRRAADLGMTGTKFGNPSGLPGADNVTTAQDLAKLSRHLIFEHPDVYKIWAEREFTYNKIRQQNRNPLFATVPGTDGMKTGYLKEVGYNLVGSAVQNGQRLIVVIGGAPTEKDRGEDARKLLEWGFRSFETARIYKAGEVIGQATVFGGEQTAVRVAAKDDVDILVPRGSREQVRAKVIYTGPIKAPIEPGQPIGRLVFTIEDRPLTEFPVVATESVPLGGLGRRALDGTRELLIGLLRR